MEKAKRKMDDPAAAEQPLSDGVRTLLSFLIFVHLFALFVAINSNFGPVSPLRRQLNVPFLRPYLKFLHMDVGYNFHLVDSSEMDAPLSLDIDAPNGDEPNDASQPISFPEPLWPNVRSGRYYQLMLNVATTQGDDVLEADLPKAIAQRILAEHDIHEGKHRLRLRRQLLVDRESWIASGGESADPDDSEQSPILYRADLSFHRDRLMLIKQENAAESAIVRPANP